MRATRGAPRGRKEGRTVLSRATAQSAIAWWVALLADAGYSASEAQVAALWLSFEPWRDADDRSRTVELLEKAADLEKAALEVCACVLWYEARESMGAGVTAIISQHPKSRVDESPRERKRPRKNRYAEVLAVVDRALALSALADASRDAFASLTHSARQLRDAVSEQEEHPFSPLEALRDLSAATRRKMWALGVELQRGAWRLRTVDGLPELRGRGKPESTRLKNLCRHATALGISAKQLADHAVANRLWDVPKLLENAEAPQLEEWAAAGSERERADLTERHRGAQAAVAEKIRQRLQRHF